MCCKTWRLWSLLVIDCYMGLSKMFLLMWCTWDKFSARVNWSRTVKSLSPVDLRHFSYRQIFLTEDTRQDTLLQSRKGLSMRQGCIQLAIFVHVPKGANTSTLLSQESKGLHFGCEDPTMQTVSWSLGVTPEPPRCWNLLCAAHVNLTQQTCCLFKWF